MIISYPSDKRSDLHSLLSAYAWSSNQQYKINHLARILGKIRNLSQILSLGSHLSIKLQISLSK